MTQRMHKTFFNRISAGLCAFLLMIFVVFSAFFVAHEVGHHCVHEEECPICACAHICENTLRGIDGGALAVAAGVLLLPIVFLLVVMLGSLTTEHTLISQKVRLNI